MPLPPQLSGSSNVTYTILLNGSPMPVTYQVASVETSSGLDQAPHAEVVFFDGSAAARRFEIADSADMSLGTRIEIRAGYQRFEEAIFTGNIRQLSPQCSRDAQSVLVVTAAGPTAQAKPSPESAPVLQVTFGESILSMNLQLDPTGSSWPALTRARGEVSFQGSSLAQLGKTIALDGIGSRSNGNALIGAVRHTIRDGEWTTFVTLGLPGV